MNISNRLFKIASHINDGEAIIDIGCDHALLDIYLAKEKNLKKIIASDIINGPLIMAKKNINNYDCQNLIQLVKGDGLEKIDTDINTIVISGLGYRTIIDILTKDIKKLNNVNKMILVPNNGFYEIRKEITKLGYYIEFEELIKENNKTYLLIVFIKGKKKYSYKQLFFGPFILKKIDNIFKDYYQEIIDKEQRILTKLPRKYIIRKHKLKKEICYIKKIIS